MTRIPKLKVLNELHEDDIWTDDSEEWPEEYWEMYWAEQHAGEMSWQWYMKLVQHKDWYHVVIDPAHKNATVANWILTEYFGECQYEYERNHFIIEREDVATLVALKWT